MFIFLVFILACLSSCSYRPSNVLSEKQMESVLYDLYIAEMEIKENHSVFYNDSIRRHDLLQSVFEKHRISEQKFDTSLVWYNAHLEQYVKINNRIVQKYDSELAWLREENERLIAESTVIDTIVLYRSPAFFLQSALRENIRAFHSDSTELHGFKKFDLQCLVLGVNDSIQPVLTFCIQCKDSTFIQRDTIRNDGLFTVEYSIPPRFWAKSIYGNFHLPAQERQPVFVGNFTVSHIKTTILTEGLPR